MDYVVTPTSLDGCIGLPITVTVFVNPTPLVIATPSSQTLTSGETTAITLTSNVPDSTFSWQVQQSTNVTGATPGTGSVIAQTLTAFYPYN